MDQKVIVFSDSLNIENCLEYKVIAEEAGFKPVFGVGTYLTSKHTRNESQLPIKPLPDVNVILLYRRLHPQIQWRKIQTP